MFEKTCATTPKKNVFCKSRILYFEKVKKTPQFKIALKHVFLKYEKNVKI